MKSDNTFVQAIVAACTYVVEILFLGLFVTVLWWVASRVVSIEVAKGFALGASLMFWLWLHRALNVLRAWDHSSLEDLTDQMERATMTVNYYQKTRKIKFKLEGTAQASEASPELPPR